MQMKRRMSYSLGREMDNQPSFTAGILVPLTEVALSDLAALFLDAYRDTIDYEGETIEDAQAELQNVMSGGFGPVIGAASICLIVDNIPASAIFVTNREGIPFIPYMVTGKKYMGRGFARKLMLNAFAVLQKLGHEEVTLAVTRGNSAAEHLYESLGFEDRVSERGL
jgi:GNAT superfamily N-acetyltransferase